MIVPAVPAADSLAVPPRSRRLSDGSQKNDKRRLERGARDYFWFALALIVVLIAPHRVPELAVSARCSGDGVDDPRHPCAPAATDSANWRSRSVSTTPFRYTT